MIQQQNIRPKTSIFLTPTVSRSWRIRRLTLSWARRRLNAENRHFAPTPPPLQICLCTKSRSRTKKPQTLSQLFVGLLHLNAYHRISVLVHVGPIGLCVQRFNAFSQLSAGPSTHRTMSDGTSSFATISVRLSL